MSHCCNCDEYLGYEVNFDDPPEGNGHIAVTWNPEDEPQSVVSETRVYCSLKCLEADSDRIPFDGDSDD